LLQLHTNIYCSVSLPNARILFRRERKFNAKTPFIKEHDPPFQANERILYHFLHVRARGFLTKKIKR